MNKIKSIKPATCTSLVTYAIVAVLFLVVAIMNLAGGMSSLFKGLLVPICTYAILAVSLNLVVGILGELSLGHAGFMCVGAYTSAFFSVLTEDTITNVWIRFPLAFIIGGVSAAIFGIIIGVPVLRLKGDYLAIVTLAFGEIIKNVVTVLYVGIDSNGLHFSSKSSMELGMGPDGKNIIKGALGITGMPKNSNFYIAFAILLITLIVAYNLVNSRSGRAIMSIRDNRIAAESIGINVTKYKLIVFALSAFFAGLAGVLYSHNLSSLTANTNNFGYNMSITILVIVVLGGIGSIRGSVISAIILTVLPELLRGVSEYRMLVYAIVLIAMMLFNNSEKTKNLRTSMSLKKFASAKIKNSQGGAK